MQSTNEILMVRPASFQYNFETAQDNIYQNKEDIDEGQVQENALIEFNSMVKALENIGLRVNVFNDTKDIHTPDSIFPNNWFSTHDDKLIIYPMYAENRRLEVDKFLEDLKDLYRPEEILDLRYFIEEDKFLESTGAMIFDRKNKVIYSSLSRRSDEEIIKVVADFLSYDYFTFYSYQDGMEIYHTNVLMSICSDFVFIADELVDKAYRDDLIRRLSKDREIIYLNKEQIKSYCGNVLELKVDNKKILTLSKTSLDNLDKKTIEKIESKMEILPIDINTIETNGGGSVRCMIGEIFR